MFSDFSEFFGFFRIFLGVRGVYELKKDLNTEIDGCSIPNKVYGF